MGQQTGRKTFKYQLQPTPQQAETQEETLAVVVRRCRALYNAGLQERRDAWQKCGVSLPAASQSAPVPELKDVRPEYREVHSQVLQAVLARLDSAFQAFLRRVQRGEKPGFPRFQARHRYHSCTCKEYGTGARRENGSLVLATIGRIAVHWSRPLAGTITAVTVARAADGWYVCCSGAAVPTTPLALSGRETGLAVGLKVVLVTADGAIVEHARPSRTATRAVKKAQQRVSRRKQDRTRRKKAVRWLANQHQTVRRQRQDVHHQTALRLVRQYDTIDYEAIQPANRSARPTPLPDGTGGYLHNGAQATAGLTAARHAAGWGHFRTILACKAACAGKRAERCHRRTRRRTGAAVGSACPNP